MSQRLRFFFAFSILAAPLLFGVAIQTTESHIEYTHCAHDYITSEPAAEFEFSQLSDDAQYVFTQALETPGCFQLENASRIPDEFEYFRDHAGLSGGLYQITYQNETYELVGYSGQSGRSFQLNEPLAIVASVLFLVGVGGMVKTRFE